MTLSKYHFLSFLLPAAIGAQTVVPLDPNCCGNAPEGEPLLIRETPRADAVNAARQKASEGYTRARVARPEAEVEILNTREGFLAGSEFVVGAYGFAIIPKGGSVVKGSRARIVAEVPQGGVKMMGWAEFVARHRGAVRSLPVSEAVLKADPRALKHLAEQVRVLESSGMTCVTTLNGNPISIPTPKTEVAAK